MTRSKYLVNNILIFTIGNLASRIITFLLVPLYTNVLSTSEYGIVDLIVTICTIAIPFISFNIEEAVLRFSLDKDANRNRILNNAFLLLIIGNAIGLLIVPITGLTYLAKYGFLIYLYVFASTFSQTLLCFLRGQEKNVKYSIGCILNTFLFASLNIVFLVFLNLGITGYLLSYIIARVITALYCVAFGGVVGTFKSFKLDKKLLLNMIKYSSLLIPNSLMWWIMNSLDHLMVTNILGSSANGIYAISYKFPTLLTIMSTIVTKAWSYSAIKEDESSDRDEFYNKAFNILLVSVSVLALVLITIIKPLMRVYVSPSFFDAWKYVPFLTIGFVFLTLSSFISTVYTVRKDSLSFLISGSIGAAVNLLLNFALIPLFGIFGAAVATCVSYFAVLLYRAITVRKYVNITVFKPQFFVVVALLVVCTLLIFSGSFIGCLAVLIFAFFAISIMFKKEKDLIIRKITAILKFKKEK